MKDVQHELSPWNSTPDPLKLTRAFCAEEIGSEGVPRGGRERIADCDVRVTTSRLSPGMMVARDCRNEYGHVLLRAGFVLKRQTLDRLKRIEKTQDESFVFYVHPGSKEDA